MDDPYFKHRLTLERGEQRLFLATAALLPSPLQIDPGVELLLSVLAEQAAAPQAILDLGCSYGALGLALAQAYPAARAVLADKDLLAVRYARFNQAGNGLANVAVVASLGVRALAGQQFDWIVSDLPTKIGDRAIEHDFFLEPLALLAPGGVYWIVADSQLNRLLPGLARRHQVRLGLAAKRRGKAVWTLRNREG